jgi:hypothetical protein
MRQRWWRELRRFIDMPGVTDAVLRVGDAFAFRQSLPVPSEIDGAVQ